MAPKRKAPSRHSDPNLICTSFKGGRRQREAIVDRLREQDVAPSTHRADLVFDASFGNCDSHLCKLLAQQWAWGLISAVQLQKYAAAAYLDEQKLVDSHSATSASSSSSSLTCSSLTRSTSLAKFVALGNHGHCPGNVARELKDLLGEPAVPPVHRERLPTKILKPGRLPSTS